jgi:aryl-alcohol dehydrogenase-like predicted oxidoreductase
VRQRSLAGREVTSIGCGDVSLAIAASRGVDSREVERSLLHALELGLTVVDVHPEADAERLVGDALRTPRALDRVVVATTIPTLSSRPGAPQRDLLPERLPAGYVQERVEATLRATRFAALPLVQLPLRPAWRTSSAWPELAGTCARLVREGKVLAWGAVVEDVPALVEAFAEPPPPPPPTTTPSSLIISLFDATTPPEPPPAPAKKHAPLVDEPWLASLALPFNFCDRTAEPIFDAAREHAKAILARRPLAGGALAGTLGPGMKLVPRDDRNAIDARTLDRIALTMAKLSQYVRTEPPAARSTDAARAFVERNRRRDEADSLTVAELALRFVLDRGAIALPRLHRHANVLDAFAAMSAPPLNPDLVARILDETSR